MTPILLALALLGQAPAEKPLPTAPSGTRRALIVCGLPGDDEHRALYAGAVESIAQGLVGRSGFDPAEVWVRFGTEPRAGDGPAVAKSRGLATREGIAADASALREAAGPDDGVWVVVLGHGHFDGRRAHLNLPGPDLSDQAFARLFEGIKAREQVFIVTTAASGFFLKPLARAGRVGIAATEADQEVNETEFPLALAELVANPPAEADRDRDGALSLFELYLAAVGATVRRFVDDERIPSEHAQLDDNGDGRGTELQMTFLPPEAIAEAKPAADAGVVPPPARTRPTPELRPRDDGYLASRIRVDRPRPTATPAAAPQP